MYFIMTRPRFTVWDFWSFYADVINVRSFYLSPPLFSLILLYV